MEADAEMHSQALGRALGVQLKRRRWDYVSKGVKTMTRKPIETADLSLCKFTDSGPTAGSHHGTDPGPLYLGDGCVAWFFCGAPGSETRTCS